LDVKEQQQPIFFKLKALHDFTVLIHFKTGLWNPARRAVEIEKAAAV
jgi:hypothetical protein